MSAGPEENSLGHYLLARGFFGLVLAVALDAEIGWTGAVGNNAQQRGEPVIS